MEAVLCTAVQAPECCAMWPCWDMRAVVVLEAAGVAIPVEAGPVQLAPGLSRGSAARGAGAMDQAGCGQIWAGKEMRSSWRGDPGGSCALARRCRSGSCRGRRAPIRRPQGPLRQGFTNNREVHLILFSIPGEFGCCCRTSGGETEPFRGSAHRDLCEELETTKMHSQLCRAFQEPTSGSSSKPTNDKKQSFNITRGPNQERKPKIPTTPNTNKTKCEHRDKPDDLLASTWVDVHGELAATSMDANSTLAASDVDVKDMALRGRRGVPARDGEQWRDEPRREDQSEQQAPAPQGPAQVPAPQADHGGPSIMERFKRMSPPYFKGESDLLLAESWMREIEKIFGL
ncbi:hypothetical protein Taro_023599 [Colocasia esculenta]|uniref:Uncharacterized protein n=1 Tax=Colocasia esculenta TaxID=4460 RepID=A0A843V539_COLES|nr:hypothetical protein [Colocasia esculenta]